MTVVNEAQVCASSFDGGRGLRIVETMDIKGLTAENVAMQCDVTPRTVTRWRSGRSIEYVRIEPLSLSLSVTKAYLLFGFTGPTKEKSTGHDKNTQVDTELHDEVDTGPQKKVDNSLVDGLVSAEPTRLDDLEIDFLSWLRLQEGPRRNEAINRVLHPVCNTSGYEVLMRLELDDVKLNRYEASCLVVLRQLRPEAAVRLVGEFIG